MSKFKKVNFSPDVAALRCLQLLYTAAHCFYNLISAGEVVGVVPDGYADCHFSSATNFSKLFWKRKRQCI
jgi:hypothetical protein